MYDCHFWDQMICPQERGVHIIEVSIRRGQDFISQKPVLIATSFMIFWVSTNWDLQNKFLSVCFKTDKGCCCCPHLIKGTNKVLCYLILISISFFLYFFISFEEVISFCQFSVSGPSLMYSIGLSSYQFLQGKDFSNWVQLMKNLLEP